MMHGIYPKGQNIRYIGAILIYDVFFCMVDLCALGEIRKPFLSAEVGLVLGCLLSLYISNRCKLIMVAFLSMLRMNSDSTQKRRNIGKFVIK